MRDYRNYKLYGFVGGNRSGKTFVGSRIAIGEAIGHDPLAWNKLPMRADEIVLGEPKLIWAVTLSHDKSRTKQQRTVWEGAPRCMLKDNCRWRETNGFYNGVAVFKNGSVIKFKSAEQDLREFESDEVDLVWIDETIPLPYVTACLARTIDRSGHIIWTTIPDSPELHDVFVDRSLDPRSSEMLRPNDVGFCTAMIYDNKYLPKQDIEQAVRMWGPEEREMRALGKFALRGQLVYKEFSDNIHLERTPDPIPSDWTKYEVFDPGITNPFAVLFAGVDPLGVVHIYDEVYERGRTPSEIAAMVFLKRWKHSENIDPDVFRMLEELLDREENEDIAQLRSRESEIARHLKHYIGRMGRSEPAIVLIDPSAKSAAAGNQDGVQKLLERHGIWTKLANNDKQAGIMRVKEYLRGTDGIPWLKVGFHCRWFRYEISHWKYQETDPVHHGQFLGDRERTQDVNDHLMDCLYMLCLDRPNWKPGEPATAPPRSPMGVHQREVARSAEKNFRGVR